MEPEGRKLELERKLRQEYERLLDQSYALCQLNVYSVEENRFLFPDINLQVYQYTQRLSQIAKELEYLTGVQARILQEDIADEYFIHMNEV